MELVIVFGPPAVGKMTVGHELCKLTGFKLLHNHMTVEPVKDIFDFGTPPFTRLVGEFRRRIIEEAAESDVRGLVLTFVWGLDLAPDTEAIRSQIDIVESRGGRARLVELYADRDERLRRNVTEFRRSQKRSLRDTEFSQGILLELDEKYVMNTGNGSRTRAHDLLEERGHLRIDNTDLPAAEVAAMIASAFGY
jgi:hypothetical protein